jgi:hypothetical protein
LRIHVLDHHRRACSSAWAGSVAVAGDSIGEGSLRDLTSCSAAERRCSVNPGRAHLREKAPISLFVGWVEVGEERGCAGPTEKAGNDVDPRIPPHQRAGDAAAQCHGEVERPPGRLADSKSSGGDREPNRQPKE